MNPPIRRASEIQAIGGTPGACDATFSTDMNALAVGQANVVPGPALQLVGARIQCQYLGRDTPTSSLLSDALEYVVGP